MELLRSLKKQLTKLQLIKEGVAAAEAEEIKAKLEAEGAKVTLK